MSLPINLKGSPILSVPSRRRIAFAPCSLAVTLCFLGRVASVFCVFSAGFGKPGCVLPCGGCPKHGRRSGVRTKFLQSRRRTVGKRCCGPVLSLLRYAPGVMLSLQRHFSSTGLSGNSFPSWGFTGTGRMVLFDREREIYPSPQARRGPPAHG